MRRLCILLCIVLLMRCAHASVALRTDGGAVLLAENGAEVVSFGTYADIVPLGGDLFAAGQTGSYALIDGEGKLRTEPVYGEFRIAGEMLLARKDGLWGMLNVDGTPQSEFIYTMIVPGEKTAWAITGVNGDAQSDMLYALCADGTASETGLYVRRIDESAGDGLLAVMPGGSDRFGYCDSSGRLVIEARFETAGAFSNGLAAVGIEGRVDIIAVDGSVVLPAEYDYVQISCAGSILAADASGAYVFDSSGELLAAHPGEAVSAGFVGDNYLIHDGSGLRIYDEQNALKFTLNGDAAVHPGLDGRLIIAEGAWGERCVHLNGSERMFQNLYPLGIADGSAVYAFLQADVARYMNNKLGEIQLSVDMDSTRYGVVDSDGDQLRPAIYKSIEYLTDNRLLVRTDSHWQMIDVSGRVYWQMSLQAAAAE